MALYNFVPKPLDPKGDKLKIFSHRSRVTGGLTIISFIDKDTKQHVCYAPSFEISGYGETIEKADEMLRVSLDEFLEWLIGLSESKLNEHLQSLGWRRDPFLKKQYSTAHVDENGVLQNFNAEEGSIKRSSLVAA